ncbi:50S ribosome-binding GTPase [Candidatus Woesearchaeota archaeon]|nr:50S ribosome-binding GTPase [Candidatus Woesearchaeota archaeon]
MFWGNVNQVIREADVILLVIDARFPFETLNEEVEGKVKKEGKRLIYVLNKCDLAPEHSLYAFKKRHPNTVVMSTKERIGKSQLRSAILQSGEKTVVGVVGYPNTGKSSIINYMKGRSSAATSSMSGYTKGIQKVRADNKIMMLDTPGVIPFREKGGKPKHTTIGAIDSSKIKDPEGAVYKIIHDYPGSLEEYYEIECNDPEEILEKIAIKLNRYSKGHVPDTFTVSRIILRDWQNGKIRQ